MLLSLFLILQLLLCRHLPPLNSDLAELKEKAERGDFGMPALDTKNPLHVLASTRPTGDTSLTYGTTYTATKDCFIVGYLPLKTNASTGATLKVNGLPIVSSTGFTYGGASNWTTNYDGSLQGFRISAGDVVTVDLTSPDMHIVKAKTT